MEKIQILIAGTPASGKSTFGKWLADTKGFIYVNMELPDTEPGSLKQMGLGSEWDAFWRGTNSESFIRAVKDRASSVAAHPGLHLVVYVTLQIFG